MLLNDDTIAIQNQLATYCRDGKAVQIEGARTERLHNYRRLVFNVVRDSLTQAYPITHQILKEEEWLMLVNDYFSQHDPQSNQIWHMPYELYEFASQSSYDQKLKRPYLLDLLYFEWIEIEVYCMPDEKYPEITPDGDFSNSRVVVNPDFRLVHLTYPVHKKSWEELENHKGNYFVLAFRHQETGKVQFMEVSAFFALAFEKLAQHITAGQALEQAAEEMGVGNTSGLLSQSLPFFEMLKKQGAILGYHK